MADIRITDRDLNDPRIDDVIAMEKSLQRSEGEFVEDVRTPFYLNPVFYYSMAGLIGGFLIWSVIEQVISDRDDGMIALISNYVTFGPVAGVIGLGIGLTYGIANRNWRQMFYTSAVGAGVGLGVSLITSLIAGWVFGLISSIAVLMEFKGDPPMTEFSTLHGIPFVLLMCGRGVAWAIISIGAGMGLGVALKSKKLGVNGLAGGMVGGMLGGLMFDPVHRFISQCAPEAALSRAVGISSVGLFVGLFIGFFENISKDAWLQMLKGPLTGKQFVLFKTPMVIGSAPKCDIYLFKDSAIEPRHALITRTGKRHMIADQDTPHGLRINGRPVTKHILQNGDLVGIGDTVLKYSEKTKNR